MKLSESILKSLKENEDWENSSEWKDINVVNKMPKFNKDMKKILEDLYGNGYIAYYNYLEATAQFDSYAEDEEFTAPTDYSTLKERLIDCATKNGFAIDKNSFSAEVTDGGEFDPDLGRWEVVFRFSLASVNK